MNLFNTSVLFVALCGLPCVSAAGEIPEAAATDEEAAEIVAAVEARYKTVEVMQADFTQTTQSPLFGEEKQRGDVTLKRPSKMFWNFTNEKQFVTDGTTMWIYTRADNQVIQYSDISSQASAADSILQSLDKISELFTIVLVETSGDAHTMRLTPKDENQQFKNVLLTLSGTMLVQRVVITDTFDNVTELSFENVKLDANIPDSTFHFMIPEGAEVITAGM